MRIKVISLTVAVVFLVTVAVPVFAQTLTKTPTASVNSQRKIANQQLQTALQRIKSQQKQQIVEGLNVKITDFNTKYTTQWTNVLTALQVKLDSLKTKASSDSANSAVVSRDITLAQTAITTAQTQVNTQANKIYTFQIVSDATLRTTVGQTVSKFRTDLMTTYKMVVDAYVAVQKVATDFGKMTPTVTPGSASSSAAQK